MLSLSHRHVARLPALAARPVRAWPPRHATPSSIQRRAFSGREVIAGMSQELLDLSLALPWPTSWPPYASTIIFMTVLSRLVLTTPFSVWAKKRERLAVEVVGPMVRAEHKPIQEQIIREMGAARVTGTKQQLQEAVLSQANARVHKRRKELLAQHGAQPWKMVVVPTAAQLPVFVLSSMTAWQMCTSPTPLDAESFFSLTSLTHPDPIFALPIAVGMITFANVETSLWFRDPAAVERAQQVEKWSSERRARGETVLRTGDFLKNLGRGAALARILWAATIPGGVALVWVTSAAYGLVQNWVFDYWDARRRRQLQAASASAPAATTLPRKPTTTKPKRPKQTSPS